MGEPHFDKHIFVCTNVRAAGHPKGDCATKGGEGVREAFKQLVRERGLTGRIRVNAAACLDQCPRGVTVVVYPEQIWYGCVAKEDVAMIVRDHVIGNEPVDRLRMK